MRFNLRVWRTVLAYHEYELAQRRFWRQHRKLTRLLESLSDEEFRWAAKAIARRSYPR